MYGLLLNFLSDCWVYSIYNGNLSSEMTFVNWWKNRKFREKTFKDYILACATYCPSRLLTIAEKTSTGRHKNVKLSKAFFIWLCGTLFMYKHVQCSHFYILGGASIHIKGFVPTPIPHQRKASTEGTWGQYTLSMLENIACVYSTLYIYVHYISYVYTLRCPYVGRKQ